MSLLRLKIDVLKSILNKELEQNNYEISSEILRISQTLDELIIDYEKENQRFYNRELA